MLKCKLGNLSLVVHLRLQYNPYKQLVSHEQDAGIAYNLKEQSSKSFLFLISIFFFLFVFCFYWYWFIRSNHFRVFKKLVKIERNWFFQLQAILISDTASWKKRFKKISPWSNIRKNETDLTQMCLKQFHSMYHLNNTRKI